MLFLRETTSVLFAYATTFVLVTVTIVGIAANIVVLVAVLGDKKMHSSSINLLLMSLAFSDLLFIIVSIPLWVPLMAYATVVYTIEDSLYPTDWCVAKTALNSSIFIYVLIATERYAAVVTPLKCPWYASRKGIVACVAVIWIISFFFNVPYFFVYGYCQEVTGVPTSVLNWDACLIHVNKVKFFAAYELADFVVTYVIPVATSVTLYSQMCYTLRTKVFPQTSGHSKASMPSDSLANRRQVIKMLVICLLIFFLCYTPMAVHLVLTFLEKSSVEWRSDFVNFNTMLLPVASTINPFIYTLYCSAFRERVKQLLSFEKSRPTHVISV